MEFTTEELEKILESLQYTKKAFSEYQNYPSYKFKLDRIKEVNAIIEKIKGYLKNG